MYGWYRLKNNFFSFTNEAQGLKKREWKRKNSYFLMFMLWTWLSSHWLQPFISNWMIYKKQKVKKKKSYSMRYFFFFFIFELSDLKWTAIIRDMRVMFLLQTWENLDLKKERERNQNHNHWDFLELISKKRATWVKVLE